MVTCHLTKLETALDQFRKSYPKLKPADAGLLASALTLTGRHALALYEGQQFRWPEDYDKLTKAMVGQLEMVQQGIEHTTKKVSKSAPEEEPVVVTVGLAPNISAGEDLLEGRDDLKALLGDVIQSGVEFVYSGMDLGWQWALDRVNWNTISGGELSRRIKIKAAFTEGAVGLEMGTGAKKRSSKKTAAGIEQPESAAVAVVPAPAGPTKAELKKAEAAAKKEAAARAAEEKKAAAAKAAEEKKAVAAKLAEEKKAAAAKAAEEKKKAAAKAAEAKQKAAAKLAEEKKKAAAKAAEAKQKAAAKAAEEKKKAAAKKAAELAKKAAAQKKAAEAAKKAKAASKPAKKAAVAKKPSKPASKSSKAAPASKAAPKKTAVAVKKASAPAKKSQASGKKAGPTRKK